MDHSQNIIPTLLFADGGASASSISNNSAICGPSFSEISESLRQISCDESDIDDHRDTSEWSKGAQGGSQSETEGESESDGPGAAQIDSPNSAGVLRELGNLVEEMNIVVVQFSRRLLRLQGIRDLQTTAWCETRGTLEPIFRSEHWQDFASEPHADSFFLFLNKLAQHRLGHGGPIIADGLERIYQRIHGNGELIKEIFADALEAGSDCQDRALYYFRCMETKCLLWDIISNENSHISEENDRQIFRTFRTMYRRERLQNYVSAYLKRNLQRQQEEVEIHLYFEQELHEHLDFVGPRPHMEYEYIGQTPVNDVAPAMVEIFDREEREPQEFYNFISQDRQWRAYLKRQFATEFAAMKVRFETQLDRVESEHSFLSQATASLTTDVMMEENFTSRVKSLQKKYEEAETRLLHAKTDEILERITGRIWRQRHHKEVLWSTVVATGSLASQWLTNTMDIVARIYMMCCCPRRQRRY